MYQVPYINGRVIVIATDVLFVPLISHYFLDPLFTRSIFKMSRSGVMTCAKKEVPSMTPSTCPAKVVVQMSPYTI
jgi:hypothetical protein